MGEMESGNSGSMQSSSTGCGGGGGGSGGGGGGDQEYESRAESISAFFNNTPAYPTTAGAGALEHAPLLQLYSLNNGSSSSGPIMFNHHDLQQQHQPAEEQQEVPSSCFDSNFMLLNSHNNNSTRNTNNNLEMGWPNKFGSTSDANCTTVLAAPARLNNNNYPIPMNTPPHQVLPLHGTAVPPPSDHNNNQSQNQNTTTTTTGMSSGPGRNPKKRSRASRRAPTTVLTTDTTNFRQMVQEFTGIPAPPFSASGFPTRTRLDLFGGLGLGMGMGMGLGMGMGMGMGMNTSASSTTTHSMDLTSSGVQQPPPPYLLRPFPQKPLPHPIPFPHRTTTTGGHLVDPPAAATSSSSTTTTTTAAAALVTNYNHQMLPFQSLLTGSKASGSSMPMEDPTTDVEPGDGLGLGPRGWAVINQGLGFGPGDQSSCGAAAAGNTSTGVPQSQASGVINATSDNHGGLLRGEGMVDSWLCSSD